jgi:hypothetical protein
VSKTNGMPGGGVSNFAGESDTPTLALRAFRKGRDKQDHPNQPSNWNQR